jgi:hypothetical protein
MVVQICSTVALLPHLAQLTPTLALTPFASTSSCLIAGRCPWRKFLNRKHLVPIFYLKAMVALLWLPQSFTPHSTCASAPPGYVATEAPSSTEPDMPALVPAVLETALETGGFLFVFVSSFFRSAPLAQL